MAYVNFQLSALLILLFTGMVFGGFFDLYRVFRSQIKVNKTIDMVGDILFWIFAAFLVVPLIYWGTWLELRVYVWIAIIIGLVFYYTFFSRLFIPVFKKFWQIMGWLPRLLMNFLWRGGIFWQRVWRVLGKK